MNALLPSVIRDDQRVTASDLVRQFGVWQDRAAREPVYVLHRGRPRLVLVSLDLMDALCSPHRGERTPDETLLPVIEAIDDVVVLFDARARVTLANPAAHARLSAGVHPGAGHEQLSRASEAFLGDALRRVMATGTPETLDIVPDRHPERRLACHVHAAADGCVLVARDATAAEAWRASEADRAALGAAIEAMPRLAAARINLRGHLVRPGAALARLSGAPAEQLATARFLTLIAVADRPRVGDLIERVIADATPLACEAALLVRGATALPVSIGLSAVVRGGRVEEVIALLAAT